MSREPSPMDTVADNLHAIDDANLEMVRADLGHLQYAIESLLADNEALRKEREWQTIETAPKDGTQFLIGRVGWSGVRVAWWSPYREDFVTGPSPMDRVVDANRWQPLPTPPQQGGDDA